MVLSWQLIWDMNLLMQLKSFSLMKKENLTLEDKRSIVRETGAYRAGSPFPGFYGSNPDGTIHTFSKRRDPDITGSIVARAVHADMYENWTDVSGFLIADPRIIKNPKATDVITLQRAS